MEKFFRLGRLCKLILCGLLLSQQNFLASSDLIHVKKWLCTQHSCVHQSVTLYGLFCDMSTQYISTYTLTEIISHGNVSFLFQNIPFQKQLITKTSENLIIILRKQYACVYAKYKICILKFHGQPSMYTFTETNIPYTDKQS